MEEDANKAEDMEESAFRLYLRVSETDDEVVFAVKLHSLAVPSSDAV